MFWKRSSIGGDIRLITRALINVLPENGGEKLANACLESHGVSIGKKENNICERLISEK